jgi:hypothetical protein
MLLFLIHFKRVAETKKDEHIHALHMVVKSDLYNIISQYSYDSYFNYIN